MSGLHSNRGAKRAREARDALGLGQDGPIEDLLPVLEDLGGVHVVVLSLPDDVAGAYIRRPGLPLLFVCGTDFAGRQRFTLAHEFGHLRMGHESVVDRDKEINGKNRSVNEMMANAFAAEFLVPKKTIQAWSRAQGRRHRITLEDVTTLACEYGVSTIMMRYRLDTCGVLRDERLAKQLDADIAAEEHRGIIERLGLRHPDDALEQIKAHLPRLPEGLDNTRLGDLLAGRTTVGRAAERMGITEERLRTMLVSTQLDQVLPPAARAAA